MSVSPQVLSTTYNSAKCTLTACIIKMGVKKNSPNRGGDASVRGRNFSLPASSVRLSRVPLYQ
jgi:hypothetical protein